MDKKFVVPTNWKLIDVTELSDPVFAQKMMGDSIAFKTMDGMITSPVEGVVNMIFPTKHALGITAKDGMELLLHIGIDTVKLKGNGFEVYVSENQEIGVNDKLVKIDKELLSSKNYDDSVIFVLTSGGEFNISKEEINIFYDR